MTNSAYTYGQKQALIKLGLWGRMLGGAAAGGAAGYLLSPYEREGRGSLYGALGGGLGAVLGSKGFAALAPKKGLTEKAMEAAGGGLGVLGGIGISQNVLPEEVPTTAEDPYHYYPR